MRRPRESRQLDLHLAAAEVSFLSGYQYCGASLEIHRALAADNPLCNVIHPHHDTRDAARDIFSSVLIGAELATPLQSTEHALREGTDDTTGVNERPSCA